MAEEEKMSRPTDASEKTEVPTKFKELVEKIETLSVLDLAELVKVLEKKFGVSAASQMVAMPTGAASAPAGAAAGEEEKSTYNIELKSVGDKKIEVIKVVRDVTEKGLKEAKDLVEAAAAAPQVVKENVKKEDAKEMQKRFEAAGAKVELK